jgi:proline racemase
VLYIEVAGCLPMCGHGTIGVATVLVETGMVEVHEPTTTIRLDTPAGLVVAEVAVRDGRAEHVTIRNVASFATALDAHVEVPGYGRVRYDMAFGGNFYAIVELAEVGVPFGREHARELMAFGLALMDAIEDAAPPVHPGEPGIHGCHHALLVAPGSSAAHSRHAMVIRPGYFDRSPCGTGTSARMAQLHARGLLGLDADFVNTSLLDRPFIGRLVEATTVAGLDAVVPTITGGAWVTGTSQYVLDPTDPFPTGFLLG